MHHLKSHIQSHIQSQYPMTGGVHLDGQKQLSCESPITDFQFKSNSKSLNDEIVLPLNMHAGAAAKPLVSVGDRIKQGEMLATAAKGISASIHSPVDGIVTAIEKRPVLNRSGLEELAIVVTANEQQSQEVYSTASDSSPIKAIAQQSAEELLTCIEQAGIVGLGGAGFPTHIKLAKKSDILIINAVECEPYITCDDRTLRELSAEVLEGALILAHILQSKKILIAIEDNKPQAIQAMLAVIKGTISNEHTLSINVIEIPTLYPSGGEKQLIERILGKQVVSGKLPASLNLTMQNVGTALAVHQAVILGQPLINRIITVTGRAVERPGNYRVPIGTSVRALLEFTGWNEHCTASVIHGGPMMGYAIADVDRPVVKTTNCIIAATTEEFPEPGRERPCIRCGKCADVCPASLLPQQLYWYSKSDEINKSQEYKLFDCIECGACSYVCPSQIPLVDYYRYAKGEILNRNKLESKAEHSKQRFDFRTERLERAELEKKRLKEERAKKRAEASKNSGVDSNQQAVADALARVTAKKKQRDNDNV